MSSNKNKWSLDHAVFMQNISTEHSEVDIYKTHNKTNAMSLFYAKKSHEYINIFMDKRRGRKPGSWKTGPNPLVHEKYKAYLVSKAQASFRGEPWLMTFEDYCDAWGIHWNLRGRDSTDLCMTRINLTGPWQKDNVMLIERGDHTRRHICNTAKRKRHAS